MKKLTCNQAKQIDLVTYLDGLGYLPQKIKNNDHWYLSPLREENTASFKVDKRLNVWYDHGIGKGGDLIDFGTLYFKCSISQLLHKLSSQTTDGVSFHPHPTPAVAGEKEAGDAENKIQILSSRPLAEPSLLAYLGKRYISLAAAQTNCKEVDFLLYSKKYTVIGFQNNAGGYELRSDNFKGSSAPKGITFIDKEANELTVFEGFFSFLSFFNSTKQDRQLTNFLVLNSLSFFEKSRELMEKHRQVSLYLDNDKAGISSVKAALQWDDTKYKDRSYLYSQHKDLNEWLIHKEQGTKQRQHIGKGFRL